MFLKRKDIVFLIELFSEKAESKRASLEFIINAYREIKLIRYHQTGLTRAIKSALLTNPRAFTVDLTRQVFDSTALHPSQSTLQEKILCSQLLKHSFQVPSVSCRSFWPVVPTRSVLSCLRSLG